MWIALNQANGMSQLIECGESIWLSGLISGVFGALIGAAIVYLLRNWD